MSTIRSTEDKLAEVWNGKEGKVCSPLPPPVSMVEKAASSVGSLEDWEREILVLQTDDDFGCTCHHIAEKKQTSIQRTLKWLKLSVEEGHQDGILPYSGLLHGLNPGLPYKGDEAAWWVRIAERERVLEKVGSFDSCGSRARRHLIRTLLAGSLSKNQDSGLCRSFFDSSLREVHLLPLISKYLVGEERREKKLSRFTSIHSLVDVASIVFCNTSDVSSLSIYLSCDNQFLCFLPLFFSLLPNLNELDIVGKKRDPHINLSLLQQVDTSKLEVLQITACSFDSLSPLSLCDLSSLHTLNISHFPEGEGLFPLNGLSSDITRSLKNISFYSCDIDDVAILSGCDLSSVEELKLSRNPYLSDLSSLRGSNLSSLKYLYLGDTNISDLSPLCECMQLVLEELDLFEAPIEDLSPLSLLDLSQLAQRINLVGSKVSDLSPLENISYDGVEVNIGDTPAMKKMEEEGLKSPQTIGKVTVKWR